MTAAPLTPLEVRLEVSKCISNLSLDFLECPYDRRSVWERYVAGHVNLHVHGSIDGMRCCAWVAANPTEVTFKTTIAPSSDIASATHEMSVFIGIGEIAECFGPFTFETRLQSLDQCLVAGREPMKPELAALAAGRTGGREMLIPGRFRIFDEKLRATLRPT